MSQTVDEFVCETNSSLGVAWLIYLSLDKITDVFSLLWLTKVAEGVMLQWKYSGTLIFFVMDNKTEDASLFMSLIRHVCYIRSYDWNELCWSVNIICVMRFVSDKGHSVKSSKKPRGEITANKTSEFWSSGKNKKNSIFFCVSQGSQNSCLWLHLTVHFTVTVLTIDN